MVLPDRDHYHVQLFGLKLFDIFFFLYLLVALQGLLQPREFQETQLLPRILKILTPHFYRASYFHILSDQLSIWYDYPVLHLILWSWRFN